MKHSRFRRIGRLSSSVLSTLAIIAILLWLLNLTTLPASAGEHCPQDGPDPVTYTHRIPDFCGCTWGVVYVNGVPVEGAVVTMTYSGQSPITPITTTTALVSSVEPYPVFMFGAKPLSIGVRYGAQVTMEASFRGQKLTPVVVNLKEVAINGVMRMIPNTRGEVRVDFGVPAAGALPTATPTPTLTDTLPLTNVPPIRLLGMGQRFTCVVVNGGVKCWGYNYAGQLGNGLAVNTPHLSDLPSVVVGLTGNVKSLAVGADHVCVLLQAGGVKCWGQGVANGINSSTSTPTDVVGLDNVVDITAAEQVTCALLQDTTVHCWGANNLGQLGNGITNPSSIPVAVTLTNGLPLTGVSRIAAGDFVCAIVQGGVSCWGGGNLNPVMVAPSTTHALEIAAGDDEVCWLKNNGVVECIKTPPITSTITTVIAPDLDNPIAKLAVRAALHPDDNRPQICALTHSGLVKCVGINIYSDLNNGVLTNSETIPITVTGLPTDVTDIAVGMLHLCARRAKGEVLCWGNNHDGQLGNGSVPTHTIGAVNVSVVSSTISSIATGLNQTCVITAAANLACWGANTRDDLGLGQTRYAVTMPVNIAELTGRAATVSLGMGAHHCAVTANGAALCWGDNTYGQLGNGNNISTTRPVTVSGLTSGVKSIVVGLAHSCALMNAGGVKCWGHRLYLGNGVNNLAHATVPTDVVGLVGNVLTITAGSNHTCTILVTGAAQCWGSNSDGQLGYGDAVSSNKPITVNNLISGVTAIAGGNFFTCAIVSGAAKCWGDNANSKLGLGTDVPPTSAVPINVPGLGSGMIGIATGRLHACALRSNGAVLCWGYNTDHTAAIGIPAPFSSPPITVTNLSSGAIAIDAHFDHTCARMNDGSARCWGWGDFGQLGNGQTSINPKPLPVPGVTPAEWTLMFYAIGDNDLSPYLNKAAKALDKLPPTTTVNIVVLVDGNGDNDTYLYEVRAGRQYRESFNRWRIAEAGTSLGNPRTLADFIAWAHVNYPAKHYYLNIADHGRGTSGIGWDGQGGPLTTTAKLTPADIRTAFITATANGAWQFDIVHFDACLMAMLENAYQIKDYARYLIASENLIAAFYPFDAYARLALNNPLIAPDALAKAIASAYYTIPYLSFNHQPRTISVLDLSQTANVNSALNTLALALIANMNSEKDNITLARTETQKFDASPVFTQTPPQYYTLTNEDEYLDLYHFAQRIYTRSSNPTIKANAQALMNAISLTFVIGNQRESGTDILVSNNFWNLDNAYGVALFFPKQPGVYGYQEYISHTLFTFTSASQWDEFLQVYYNAISASPAPLADPGVPPVIKPAPVITTHCPNNLPCLWGAVIADDESEVEGAQVVVSLGGQTIATTTTALVSGSEVFPFYRVPLSGLNIITGTALTITANYSNATSTHIVRFAPISHEQVVNIKLSTPTSHPVTGTLPLNTTLVQAFASPPVVTQGVERVLLYAAATTNEGYNVATYHWQSNLDGDLGASSALALPASALKVGVHTITVTATNDADVTSLPVTLTLTVKGQVFLPLITR